MFLLFFLHTLWDFHNLRGYFPLHSVKMGIFSSCQWTGSGTLLPGAAGQQPCSSAWSIPPPPAFLSMNMNFPIILLIIMKG